MSREALKNRIELGAPRSTQPDGYEFARTDMPDIADRRVNKRFLLRLAVKCRRIEPRVVVDRIIVGESLNISSKGLLFTTNEVFTPGQVVEAFLDWPMLLDSRVRLTLVVEGVVVWAADDQAAMRIEKYQFRTRSNKLRPGSPQAAAAYIPRPLFLSSSASD